MAKITSLKYCRKADLQNLAEVLGVEIEPDDNMAAIIRKIESASDYDQTLALAQAEYIVRDREEEKQRLEQEKQWEREEKERERQDKEKEREFTLEQLRLSQTSERRNSTASSNAERQPKLALKTVMHRFDPDKSDITLFLNLFERQANRVGIETEDYVTHLLSLLPIDIAELILREPADQIENFAHVKSLLLARYRLSPEAYRVKLNRHAKNPGSPWKDLIFELDSFLEGWLHGLGISDFSALKKLLITDQIKRRAPTELKEHFIDSWANYTDPLTLATKLDEYEAVKVSQKKSWNAGNAIDRRGDKPKIDDKSRERKNETETNWRKRNDNTERQRVFERPSGRKCFLCSSFSHVKADCPENEKN